MCNKEPWLTKGRFDTEPRKSADGNGTGCRERHHTLCYPLANR